LADRGEYDDFVVDDPEIQLSNEGRNHFDAIDDAIRIAHKERLSQFSPGKSRSHNLNSKRNPADKGEKLETPKKQKLYRK